MNKNKKITLIISIALVSIILLIGVTYAALNYSSTSTNQDLVLGDIYMRYNEISGLSITDAVPGSDYSNYFEFTISGKNTYTKKDIYYDFILNKGDLPTGKTEDNRIPDKYLKFKLVSVDTNNQETIIFQDETYASLNNQRIHVETIEKNTTSEVNRKYRLYMTIDNSLLIGNTSDAVFTFDEWESAFGSVKLNVTGDFTEKEVPITVENSEDFKKLTVSKNTDKCKTYVEEDGITYISGTKECIDFNYVWYSGKLWRITAIYPDGSMKMITDSAITTIEFGEKATISDTDLTSAYSTTYMREWLNQEFLSTLYDYKNIIYTNTGWYSILDNSDPPTKPTGDYTLIDPVGLLNTYEYYMAVRNATTSTNYLNIGYYWSLITPYDSSYMYCVDYQGYLDRGMVESVRPTITLQSNIQLSKGSGTIDNPYRIKGDIEEVTVNTTPLNTRYSGEYVKLENDESSRLFRIVDKELVGEKITTKLVLNDYIKESDVILTKRFSSSGNLWNEVDDTDTTFWRGYLNTTWLATLDTNILEKGTYYFGYHTSGNYKTTVCSEVSSEVSIDGCIENGTVVSNISNDYVGLLRIGEMFACQTNDYTWENASNMWILGTGINSSYAYDIILSGSLFYHSPKNQYFAARPAINLTNKVVIKSGTGTKQDPFVVGLPN